MLKRLAVFLILMCNLAVGAWAQGNTVTLPSAGAPTGTCAFMMFTNDTTNGNLYFCDQTSHWKVLSAAAGNLTATTPTAYGIMYGQGTQALGVTAAGAADTIFMGNDAGTGAAPAFKAGPSGGTNGCAGATDTPIYNTSTHAWGCHQIVGTVTSVGLSTDADFLTVGSSPVTGSGTITLNKTDSLAANEFEGTPNGSTGKVSLRAITAADIPKVYKTCAMVIGADNATAALADADLGPQLSQCQIPQAFTVVEIDVMADGGTPNIIVQRNHLGTPTALLSSALATASSGAVACAKTGATTGLDGSTTCSALLENTAGAAGDWIGLTSGTAGGVAKRLSVMVHVSVP